MSPNLIAITCIIVMLLFMLILRMPVGFAMALAGFLGLCYMISPQAAFNIVGAEIWGQLSSYTFTVIPMFIWMGYIAFNSGLSERLYETAYKWFGQLPGGLAISTIGACAAFGAICGSNTATTATMGTVALPQMKKYNYDMEFSAGTVAAAGTLGIVIPPSIALIVYGTFTQTDISELFIAAIFPGIILAGLMMVVVYMRCRFNRHLGPAGPKTSFREKVIATKGVIETLVLFVLVIGGLYIGWFTPTEAGAAGAFGALVLGFATRRLNLRVLWQALIDSTKVVGALFCIVVGAFLFNQMLVISHIPDMSTLFIAGLAVPPMVILIGFMILFLILGCFMSGIAIMYLCMPTVYPITIAMGWNPIWFGIIFISVYEIGMITPPFGITLFAAKAAIGDISMETIIRGIGWFLVCDMVRVALLIAFPQIALFLPSTMR